MASHWSDQNGRDSINHTELKKYFYEVYIMAKGSSINGNGGNGGGNDNYTVTGRGKCHALKWSKK